MKTIALTQGAVALVDDSCWEDLSRWRWCVSKSQDGKRHYAVRRASSGIVWMHRQIVGAPENLDVDHRDGNGLNNQRGNLRAATRRQNSQNMVRSRAGKTSRFKGVSLSSGTTRWRATIKVDGRRIHLGYFIDEGEAARAYDAAALKHFGEFAAPNERTTT